MKLTRATDATDQSVIVFLEDATSANAAGKTGIADTAVTAYYSRVETDNDVTVAAISLSALSAITDAHTDGGWIAIDGTNMPGYYRLDIPDAVCAAGATEAQLCLKPASGTAWKQVNIEIQLNPPVALGNCAHGGSSATLTLRKFGVNNTVNGETALSVESSGTGNAHALYINATGGGKGIAIGAASVGVSIDSSDNEAMTIQGGTNKDGLKALGNGTGVGIKMEPTYHARVVLSVGTSGDVYSTMWYADGVPITSGVTDGTIAFQDDDGALGADLIQDAQDTSGALTYTQTTGKIVAGHTRNCYVAATIAGATRTYTWSVTKQDWSA